jgi:hypothetical protein
MTREPSSESGLLRIVLRHLKVANRSFYRAIKEFEQGRLENAYKAADAARFNYNSAGYGDEARRIRENDLFTEGHKTLEETVYKEYNLKYPVCWAIMGESRFIGLMKNYDQKTQKFTNKNSYGALYLANMDYSAALSEFKEYADFDRTDEEKALWGKWIKASIEGQITLELITGVQSYNRANKKYKSAAGKKFEGINEQVFVGIMSNFQTVLVSERKVRNLREIAEDYGIRIDRIGYGLEIEQLKEYIPEIVDRASLMHSLIRNPNLFRTYIKPQIAILPLEIKSSLSVL